MKRIFLFFSLLIFSTSCSEPPKKKIGGNEATNKSNDKDTHLVEDKDCVALSKKLPDDVLAQFELVSTNKRPEDPLFLKKSIELLRENIPDFINYHLVETHPQRKILGFEFSFEGIPLCSSYAKVYATSKKIVITGNLPEKELKINFSLLAETPSTLSLSTLQESLESLDVRIENKKNICYAIKNKTLVPVWKQKVKKQDEPYLVLANGGNILSLQPLFFHSTGNLQTYDEDDSGGEKFSAIKTYTLDNMSSGGTLCNERFQLVPEDGEPSVKKEDFKFFFNPEEQLALFEQVSLFVYAEKQSEYIANLEYTKKWYGPQVLLIPDMKNNGLTNSAQYIPGDYLARPEIRIPKGDDIKLHQLRIDNEAIQHEVGHHVVFRSVTIPEGESLVIHEGIADAFVELRTKNACLGEHFCLNDLLCVSLSCLRSADNNYRLSSEDLPSEPHLKSQLISGLLWELALEIGHDKTAAILNYAIDFLPKKAYFSDLITALFDTLDVLYRVSDHETFASYCKSLMSVYDKKGFLELATINNLSCEAGE